MTLLLSLCIPSYNRASFLPDLLDSILLECTSDSFPIEEVEVVLCDNASMDKTPQVASFYQEAFERKNMQFVYQRLEKNIGPDLCIAKSIEKASGLYCWLMGDDDKVEEGAMAYILSRLKEVPSLVGMTLGRRAYDLSLKTSWIEPAFSKKEEDELFLDASSCFEKLFPFFGFLSAQVIRRKLYLQAFYEEEKISSRCNAYLLVYLMGKMIQKKPCWLYLHRPCVGWRSGNDSFAKELGLYRRFILDLIGYKEIAQALFQEDRALYRKVMNQICSSHFLAHVKGLKKRGGLQGKTREILVLCTVSLKDIASFWHSLLPLLLTPAWCLIWIRSKKSRFIA
jgi:abequosyltransferase